jgi:hypothetical protein
MIICVSLVAKISVTQAKDGTYNVTWEIPQWKIGTQGNYSTVKCPGIGIPAEAGVPQLPFDECKIAIPQMGSVDVSIIRKTEEDIILEKRIIPVPELIKTETTDLYEYTINEQLYSSLSRNIISPLSAQRFRKLFFVPIQINPFIYDGDKGLKVITKIEFNVRINGNVALKDNIPMDELTAQIAKQMLNPAQAALWQTSEKARVNYADFASSNVWLKIETDKDGIFRLTHTQLNSLPLNDIDPRQLRMFTTGGEVHPGTTNYMGPSFKEIPIFVSGESDGVFNTTDYILFYGRDRDGFEMNQNIGGNVYVNPYSKNGCFWLTFGNGFDGNPLRIEMAPAETQYTTAVTNTPETVRIENEAYQRLPIGFEWFMGKFFGNISADYTYSIDLDDVDTDQNQTLSMLLKQEYLRTGSSQIHKVRLKVNGNDLVTSTGGVQEWSWVGLSPITLSHTGKYFNSGSNNILINVIRSNTDNLFFDFYQVAYSKKLIKRNKQFVASMLAANAYTPIRYDFTGSSANVRVFKALVSASEYNVTELPVNLTAGGFSFISSGNPNTKYYLAQDNDFYAPASVIRVDPVDIANESNSYDNIIIAAPEYEQQAHALASFYIQKWEKKSKIVLLQDIFNQFNSGMPDPNAVRLFLKHCVESYPSPAITTVTLLGSGTLDWRNFSGQSATKNKIIVYQKNSSTTDDYFGMLYTDQYPELAIGRYPVRTTNELNTMLQNLNSYVSQPQSGMWRNNLVFLADDEFNGPSTGEYSHSEQLQETSEIINKSILIDKIFALEYEFDEFQNKPKARDDMVKAINDGKLIWYYIGHGSFDTLGAEDYFQGALDMGRFNNPDKLTLFVAASCDVAQFDSFSFDCLAEKVVLLNNKGAIASIAATRECNGPANVALLQHYYKYSLNYRNPIGYSLLKAKFDYTVYNSNDEKYNILGDPLLLVTTPQRDSSLVIQTQSKSDILQSRMQANVSGQFPAVGLNNTASFQVYDSEIIKRMPNNATYTLTGRSLFKGETTVTNSQYSAGFIVPDDVTTGNRGLILSYIWDDLHKKDYINYYSPVNFSDQAVAMDNPNAPQIELYLDNDTFVNGGSVGTNPMLIAKISDENGINITNSPGHSIFLILDQAAVTTNVTNYFTYNKDSFTHGTLNYQLSGLSEGNHILQLIAFDNLNKPAVSEISFSVNKGKTFTVESFLPYPNPMKKGGYFTFDISDIAEVKLAIYTPRGRKIKTITASATKGYNQIWWDGRDNDGDFLANNTYFVKLTAKSLTGKNKVEKTEKLVIYH